MSTPTVAHTSIAAAKAAAEAEGVFDPTPEELEQIKRHKALRKRAAKVASEMAAIEDSLKASMDSRGALKLAVDNKNQAQFYRKTSTRLDTEALAAAHPEIHAEYTAAKEKYDEVSPSYKVVETDPKGNFKITP